MSNRGANPLLPHTLLAFGCLVIVQLAVPAELEFWRRALAGVFAITLGFQLGAALFQPTATRAARIKLWLECIAFPLLIGATLLVPETTGLILFGVGFAWRFLVAMLFRPPPKV